MYQTTVGVDGMMCGMCEAHVNDALRRVDGVKKTSSSYSKGQSEVIAEDAVDTDRLRAAVEETGYKVLSISAVPYEKKGLFSRFKK